MFCLAHHIHKSSLTIVGQTEHGLQVSGANLNTDTTTRSFKFIQKCQEIFKPKKAASLVQVTAPASSPEAATSSSSADPAVATAAIHDTGVPVSVLMNFILTHRTHFNYLTIVGQTEHGFQVSGANTESDTTTRRSVMKKVFEPEEASESLVTGDLNAPASSPEVSISSTGPTVATAAIHDTGVPVSVQSYPSHSYSG